MLYATWFMVLLILYMAIAPIVLMRNLIPNAKAFFKKLFIGVVTFIFCFYFIIPVPTIVQEKQIFYVNKLIGNNENLISINMKYWLASECNANSSLKAYQYFMFLKAFKKDIDATMDLQKFVDLGGIESPRKDQEKNLCKLNLN